jgi:hypothetical protein
MWIRTLLLGLTMALPFAAQADRLDCPTSANWPPAFKLEYSARASYGILNLSGQNVLTLKRDGASYDVVSETNAGLLSARQSSRGRMGARGLVPLEYVERNLNRAPMTTRFDWPAQTVSFTETEDTVPTAPQMQDRLSVTLQVAWTLRNKSPVTSMPVAGVRGASIYKFVTRGNEAIDTPAGRFDTVKVERPMDEDDDRIEVWLAPSLCYLPVRTRFTERKGTIIANELKAASFE